MPDCEPLVAIRCEIAELDTQLTPLVAAAAPRTTGLLGSPPGTPASRCSPSDRTSTGCTATARSPPSAAPARSPVSSGRTNRHRLNYGGDRNANRTLHMIAVCRLRYCPDTRAYAERRTVEGKTKPELIRCLKRYIARQICRTLRPTWPISSTLDIYWNVPGTAHSGDPFRLKNMGSVKFT